MCDEPHGFRLEQLMRTLNINTLIVLLGLLSALPVHAAGVVVRLVSSGSDIEGDVVVTVVNGAETETRFVLLDDGQPPDVFGGDNQFSAAGMLTGTEATVFLTLGDEKIEAGEVSWPDETTSRDLVITKGDGILTVENSAATVASDMGAAGGPPGEAGTAGGALPPAGTNAAGRGPNGGDPIVTFPEGAGLGEDDTTLYLLGGALMLVLAGAAFMWLRSPAPSAGAAKPSRLYTQAPEPGLLGSAAPSLSDGLSTWRTAPSDTDAFMGLLLQSMAQHHRVLVVCGEETLLPPTHGGPVFRARQDTPIAIADAAAALMDYPGLPLAVLVARSTIKATMLHDYATVLTPDVGVVTVLNECEGAHPIDVEVSKSPSGWTLDCDGANVQVQITEWGVRVSQTKTAPRASSTEEADAADDDASAST
jgi:hypothetical protein